MEKQEIRAAMKQRFRQSSEEDLRKASALIAQRVLALPAYQHAKIIMAYVSMPTEPDTEEIIQDAMVQGKMVLLPRCFTPPEMEALPYRGPQYMQCGRWNIPEPVPLDEQPSAEKLWKPDLILVPCVAATRDGRRLGHGAGYYDWYLQTHPSQTVCLCFHFQLMDSIPTTSHDIRMDQVIWDE